MQLIKESEAIKANEAIKPTFAQPVAIISSLAPTYVKTKLAFRGFCVLEIPQNELIYDEVCTHPDLFLHHCLGKRSKLFVAQELPRLLGDKMGVLRQRADVLGVEISTVESPLKKTYPGNVLLNGVQVGGFLLGNPDTLSSELLKAHECEGHKLIKVKQGYTKCSVSVVSNNALITEDEGIAQVAVAHGIDVLKLEKGHVSLKGFHYGFIGGCTGTLSEQELMFVGNLDMHPQSGEILEFCKRHQTTVVNCEGPLVDVGSILVF